MRSYIDDDELEALRGLAHEARTLYREGLRPYMDYSTGLVGVKRVVCYKGFRELIEVTPDRGSKRGSVVPVTKSMVRSLVALLERHGLVEKIPQSSRIDTMVFRLPLAGCDEKNRENEQRHKNDITATAQAAAQKNHLKVVNNQCDKENKKDCSGIGEQHSNNSQQRHTSVLPFTTTTTINTSNARGDEILLPADWCPSVDTMTRLVGDEFVDVHFVDEYTTEFVIYWSVSGVAKGSWDAVFFRQCLQQWKHRRFSWSQR
jgi:hypothetical protein